jgi:hypothetical protein
MWDLHHCKNAVKREAEFAPRMNALLEHARSRGCVHCPCTEQLHGVLRGPSRAAASATGTEGANLPADIGQWCRVLPAEEKVKVSARRHAKRGGRRSRRTPALGLEELAAKGLNPKRRGRGKSMC